MTALSGARYVPKSTDASDIGTCRAGGGCHGRERYGRRPQASVRTAAEHRAVNRPTPERHLRARPAVHDQPVLGRAFMDALERCCAVRARTGPTGIPLLIGHRAPVQNRYTAETRPCRPAAARLLRQDIEDHRQEQEPARRSRAVDGFPPKATAGVPLHALGGQRRSCATPSSLIVPERHRSAGVSAAPDRRFLDNGAAHQAPKLAISRPAQSLGGMLSTVARCRGGPQPASSRRTCDSVTRARIGLL